MLLEIAAPDGSWRSIDEGLDGLASDAQTERSGVMCGRASPECREEPRPQLHTLPSPGRGTVIESLRTTAEVQRVMGGGEPRHRLQPLR